MHHLYQEIGAQSLSEKPMKDHVSSYLPNLEDSSEFQLNIDLNTGTTHRGTGICWTQNENSKYIAFLKENLSLFSLSLRQRKIIGVHILMSRAVKTRNPKQCRSHHQKMMCKYKTILNIIAELTKEQSSISTKLEDLSIEDVDISRDNLLLGDSIWDAMINDYDNN